MQDDFRFVVLLCSGLLGEAAGQAQVHWVRQDVSGPPARTYASMAYDAVRQETVLFGGVGAGGALSDTWTWNGLSWTQRSPSVSPSARQAAAMTFDEAHGEVVLFSGGNPNTAADTWVWNGTTWSIKTPANAPTYRLGGALVYDPIRRNVVLFGGTGTGVPTDTWIWDGVNWTQRFPSTSPPAPASGTVVAGANDVNGNVVVMIGSTPWTWNGTTWTQGASIPQYPGRISPAFAYHAGLQRALLHGGYSPEPQNFSLPDLWLWDGTAWTQAPSTSPNPGARYGHRMVYDQARQTIVLFGGSTDTATWLLAALAGSISVSTNQSSASFAITGPTNYSGAGTSLTVANAPVGTYTITFAPVVGYSTPPSQTQTLATGGTIAFNGDYIRSYTQGTLTITTNHPEASFSASPALPGYQNPISMQPSGGLTFSRTFTNLPGGTYTVTFNAVPQGGYAIPLPTTVLIDGNTVGAKGNYVLTDPTVDTDGDGLPDAWEAGQKTLGGISYDFPAMGASPFRKDIFAQVDWLEGRNASGVVVHSHRPLPSAMAMVQRSFLLAPVSNPDGTAGISLHLDFGPQSIMIPQLDSGSALIGQAWASRSRGQGLLETADRVVLGAEIASNYIWDAFDAVKATATPHSPQVFHYAIFAHCLPPGQPDPTYDCSTTIRTGVSRKGLFSSIRDGAGEFVVGLTQAMIFPLDFRLVQAATFMHELGHNLGLAHGGVLPNGATDDTNYKPNYLSVMNYAFDEGLLLQPAVAVRERVDYSRAKLLDLNGNSLSEAAGLGPGATDAATNYGSYNYCAASKKWVKIFRGSDPIDWNCSTGGGNTSTPDPGTVAASLLPGALQFALLAPESDWSRLVFRGGAVGSDFGIIGPSVSPHDELSLAGMKENQTAPGRRCNADANRDGIVDGIDLALVRSAFGTVNGRPGYDDRADVNGDGVVNILDLAMVSRQQGCRE